MRFLIFLGLLLSIFACTPGTQGYSCVGGNCIPIADNAQYSSYELCMQLGCVPDTIGYVCDGQSCLQVALDSAQYGSLEACERACR